MQRGAERTSSLFLSLVLFLSPRYFEASCQIPSILARASPQSELLQGCSRSRESATTRCGSLGSNACDTGDTSQSQPSRGQHGADGGGRDGDLLSSAIRRFNFKSAGGSRSCRTVPKVVVMGSSTASETTINTSTDSANTMLTMVGIITTNAKNRRVLSNSIRRYIRRVNLCSGT